MGRKMIETCNHCGKKEVTELDLTMVLHEKTKMHWATHTGKRFLICSNCMSELGRREEAAAKQIRSDFIAECKEDTDNA